MALAIIVVVDSKILINLFLGWHGNWGRRAQEQYVWAFKTKTVNFKKLAELGEHSLCDCQYEKNTLQLLI